ncbi:unnamed protein product [Mytilus edulis]|uniref:DNA-directed DNA polymerase n=1 Tax=Mytilus edulis TaxID=6550 RepID=A0A8S3UAM7_MYTED|nr:unnamed protein product [Mytilus edulis]
MYFSTATKKEYSHYDYVDTEQKLENLVYHPKKIFNKLGDTHISDEDYQFAQTVWDKLKVKTLGEYSDVYLKKMDVALLADVFEKFRDISLHDYDLDPVSLFHHPGFSWSAMLKKGLGVAQTITDIDMMLFVEREYEAVYLSIFHRYAKANNPYLFDTYG